MNEVIRAAADVQARGAEEEGRQQRRRRERAQRRSERAEEKRSFVAAPTATAPAPEERPGRRRGRQKRRAVTAADGTGMKYFEKRAPLLERLHEVGGERDKAGNRELHYDELCLLLLLGLFRPVVDSLRGLQPTSALAKVQQRLKRGRASLGSLSEAARVFDAELLKPSIEELGAPLQPRWQIELFLRFFKQIMGCRKLSFRSQNGIELQAYCAIIACVLICLWTGRKPTKRTYEMICYYFLGLAREAELLAHLEKLKQQAAAQNGH